VASANAPAAQATAPQSFTVALRTPRSVVATTLKLGYSWTAVSIIDLKLPASSEPPPWMSVSGTSKPRQAVKSSSLPIITSTRPARRRLTSRARSWPPTAFHRLGR
jgi:hypothetical protein